MSDTYQKVIAAVNSANLAASYVEKAYQSACKTHPVLALLLIKHLTTIQELERELRQIQNTKLK